MQSAGGSTSEICFDKFVKERGRVTVSRQTYPKYVIVLGCKGFMAVFMASWEGGGFQDDGVSVFIIIIILIIRGGICLVVGVWF